MQILSLEAKRICDVMDRTAQGVIPGQSVGEVIAQTLDEGKRDREGPQKEYRLRTPTNSERLNRALVELRPGAFKVHMLLWKWRGAPARGTLPFFTIRSLQNFCRLTRPTVRVAMIELTEKGWIVRKTYNKHHKNALYTLVPIRKVPSLQMKVIKND